MTNRVAEVMAVQEVLTEHGCNIRTRLGLHEVSRTVCLPMGLLILDTFGEKAEIAALEKKLKKIKGLVVRKMVF